MILGQLYTMKKVLVSIGRPTLLLVEILSRPAVLSMLVLAL
jgi:hypothetical protein